VAVVSLLEHGCHLRLTSKTRRGIFVAAALVLVLLYLGAAGRYFVAAYEGSKPNLQSLLTAARLDPQNAEIRYALGRFYLLVNQDAQSALASYRAAIKLNPHAARYWLSLAEVYEFLGSSDAQDDALKHAIAADPRTPEVAWTAANFYMVRGQTEAALREFRVVMENDPYLPGAALAYCWRIHPDADALLRDALPPSAAVHLAFLELLVSRKETAAAAKTWERLAALGQAIPATRVLEYVRYLIEQGDVNQAQLVWRQAAPLANLSAYLPSTDNLVVNGDFGLDVLNGGFDWIYQRQAGVSLALDPTEFHSGHRSLSIGFDGQGVRDAGIRELIPVQAGAAYDFSAYFKAINMQGAGGPRLSLQDYYSNRTYFTSDDLKDADFWKAVDGNFTTDSNTRLLSLRIERFPTGSPIRGQLWLDDIRLVRK
jgi:tetratricopeptide (TPR) repeat protein